MEREALKWSKLAKGRFQLFHKSGADHLENQPDVMAETETKICMRQPKRREKMTAAAVLAKKAVAMI